MGLGRPSPQLVAIARRSGGAQNAEATVVPTVEAVSAGAVAVVSAVEVGLGVMTAGEMEQAAMEAVAAVEVEEVEAEAEAEETGPTNGTTATETVVIVGMAETATVPFLGVTIATTATETINGTIAIATSTGPTTTVAAAVDAETPATLTRRPRGVSPSSAGQVWLPQEARMVRAGGTRIARASGVDSSAGTRWERGSV
jgi:hypothetical protein